MPSRSLVRDALVGAAVTTVLGVVPFSELAGGGVAGYLHGRRGARVGALSGLLAAVPKAGLLFLVAVLFGYAAPESPGQALAGFLLVLGGMAAFLGIVGAVAGHLGAYCYRYRDVRPPVASTEP